MLETVVNHIIKKQLVITFCSILSIQRKKNLLPFAIYHHSLKKSNDKCIYVLKSIQQIEIIIVSFSFPFSS